MVLKNEAEKLNICLDDNMIQSFEEYYKFLISYNENVNLTAITDYDEVMIKHFYDSLLLSLALPCGKIKLIDIGAGAGFPSVPNAIYNNDLDVTIVDSLNKRIVFLNELIKLLKLNNVSAVHARAEEYAVNNKEKFDVATARAVARLNILSELCLPFVKVGGYFIALKSKNGNEEMAEALNGIKILGGEIIDVKSYSLPLDMGDREIIIIKKVKETPKKYPRRFNVIKNSPLR